MQNIKVNYRIYPTSSQEQKLLQISGSCRYVHNFFLAKEIDTYDNSKKFNFYNQNCLDLTKLKQHTLWLKDVPAVALQQSLKDLDLALRQSFKSQKHRKGFPQFKKRHHCNASFNLTMASIKSNVDLDKSTFYIPKVGDVKCRYHRQLPSDFKSCRVIRKAPGVWEVCLTCTVTALPKQQIIYSATGVDINSKAYVLSDGTAIAIPKFLREKQSQIKKAQRKIARAKKGSNNRKKLVRRLAKIHYRIKQQRLNFFHQLSRQLVDRYDVICLEDLNVKQIQKKFGRVTQDNGFSMFRQLVEYKTELAGKYCSIINRYCPSSQICSCCGKLTKHQLMDRTYTCKHCNFIIDRDHNAAINILRVGITPELFAKYANNQNACGASLAPDYSIIGRLLGIETRNYAL